MTRVNLAEQRAFRLGVVSVDPQTRRIRCGMREEMLEPRVMQVLVALAAEPGRVLSRDRLIELCWEGRIVGDNAINRVLSKIRRLSSDYGAGSFEIETIAKVGYRLTVRVADAEAAPAAELDAAPEVPPAEPALPESAPPESALPEPTLPQATPEAPVPEAQMPQDAAAAPPAIIADPAPPSHALPPAPARAPVPRFSRRLVIGGAIAAGAGGTLAIGGAMLGPAVPSAAARELFRRGEIAQRQGLPDQVRQAAAFYRQATEADPRYAAAWGALALSYRHMLEGYGAGDQTNLPLQLRSAAARALALDPENADAQLALATLDPFYRHWQAIEPALARLGQRWPNHWLIQAQRGLLCQDVGRMNEAIGFAERVQSIDPFLPVTHSVHARALSCAGRVTEAEGVIERALNRWPGHPLLWLTRFNVLLFNRRFEKAAAFALDPDLRPADFTAQTVARRAALARALAEGDRTALAAEAERARREALDDLRAVPSLAPLAVLLGAPDLALAMLESYYFGGSALGAPVPPPGRYDRRVTVVLFSPPLRPLAANPRFRALFDRTGLAAYWQAVGRGPDGGLALA